MRSFVIYIPHQIYQDDQNMEHWYNMGEVRSSHKIFARKCEVRHNFQDRCLMEDNIRVNIKKLSTEVWAGFTWP